MIPLRIQRKRTKGWRMPPNTASVTRPGRWGNAWKIGGNMFDEAAGEFRKCETIADCVKAYRQSVDWEPPTFEKPWRMRGGTSDEPTVLEFSGGYSDEIHVMRRSIRKYLAGKSLACYCRLCPQHEAGKPLGVTCAECTPCHADVLLEIANQLRCEAVG